MNQITPKTGYAAAQDGLASAPSSETGPSKMASDKPTPARPERAQSDTTPSGLMPMQGQAKGAAQKPAPAAAAPTGSATRPALTEADARLIHRILLTGDGAIARRSDLGDMYGRVVNLFKTLNDGVGQMYVDKAEQDRKGLSKRIDGLEEAVNRMEGALRIELEPVLRAAMADVVAEQAPAKTGRAGRIWMALALVAAVAAGAVFHAPLTQIVSDMETEVSAIMAKLR